MSDFFQNGIVATFHRLKETDLDRLENELLEFASNKSISLILPTLYSEIHGPGLKGIFYSPQEPYLLGCGRLYRRLY